MAGIRLQHTLHNAVASSSRTAVHPHAYLSNRFPPFFTAPGLPPTYSLNGKGKEHGPDNDLGPGEEEVSDAEWEIRVGECRRASSAASDNFQGRAMRHLRETLPHFFHPPKGVTMYPPEIFSHAVTLKLPPPLPLKVSWGSSSSSALTMRLDLLAASLLVGILPCSQWHARCVCRCH